MALTQEQLEDRRHYVGGSDVPAILGVSPYANATDVWLAKTGRLEVKPHPSLAAEIGDRMEPMLVEWTRDRVAPGANVERDRHFHHDNGIFRAQVDGWLPDRAEVIESKTSGLVNGMWRNDEWGADGTDHVPFAVLAQVNFQLLCTGADAAHVAAFLGAGVGPRFYLVERSQGLIDDIRDVCERFWNDNVLADVQPEARPSLEALEEHVREPLKMVTIDESYGDWWMQIQEQEAKVKGAKEEARRQVLEEMGDAEIGATMLGEFSYKSDKNGKRRFLWKERKG